MSVSLHKDEMYTMYKGKNECLIVQVVGFCPASPVVMWCGAEERQAIGTFPSSGRHTVWRRRRRPRRPWRRQLFHFFSLAQNLEDRLPSISHVSQLGGGGKGEIEKRKRARREKMEIRFCPNFPNSCPLVGIGSSNHD